MNRVGDTLIHTGANEALVQAFVTAGVEFVLIGGLAVAWFCPERQADDMDLLVNPTPENSARIAGVLSRLRISGFDIDSFVRHGLQVPLKQTLYAELLTPETAMPSFDEVERTAVDGKLFNHPVRIASVESLIRFKERAAGAAEATAQKHRDDVRLLQAHAA